jgi:DNA-binding MarR family transcriptional regulator
VTRRQAARKSSIPLARLLAVAYRSLTVDLHTELRARGWADVRPAYGFVLLALQTAPTTSGELSDLLGITKQATSKIVQGMEEDGYLTRTVDGADGRQKPLVLTNRGRELVAAVEQIYGELEGRWAKVIGADEVERIRKALTAALTDGGRRELPAIRPTW